MRKKILERDMPFIEKVINPKGEGWHVHHIHMEKDGGTLNPRNLVAMGDSLHREIHSDPGGFKNLDLLQKNKRNKKGFFDWF